VTDERIEEAREALGSLELGDDWEAAIEGDFPAPLAMAQWEALAAYRRGRTSGWSRGASSRSTTSTS
jgi:hypothetical protein